DLTAAVAARGLLIAVPGAIVAVLVAVALSPAMPLPGTSARRAELHSGLSVDATVVGLGATALVVLVVAGAAALNARVRRARAGAQRGTGPHLARVIAAVPWLVPRMGIGYALSAGRGRRSVPVRSALVAATAAVAI